MTAYNRHKLRPTRNFSFSMDHQISGFGTVTVTDSLQTNGASTNPASELQSDLPTNYQSSQTDGNSHVYSTYTQDDSTNDKPS
ncbi:hypothetical protein BGX20_006468 [Mortierella sp. AD010]|nr:hypothetical protein BGX20_006468 [Mortierella sp. AD010]